MSESDLQLAQKTLAIQDVYLCDASVWANRKNNPAIQIPNLMAQMRLNPTNEIVTDESVPPQGATHFFVRYFVGTGVRFLGEGVDQTNQNLTRDDLIAEVEATFVARYAVLTADMPAMHVLQSFNENAVFHVWPYWREFLQAAAIRLRIPPLVLPMRMVNAVGSPASMAVVPAK
jgi:hypothetical protein